MKMPLYIASYGGTVMSSTMALICKYVKLKSQNWGLVGNCERMYKKLFGAI